MELGKKVSLYVVKKTPMGLFLNEDADELLNSLTLNKHEMQSYGDVEVGGQIDLYCYRNREGKLCAATNPPKVCNGEIGILEAVESNHNGAFLDWGYDKDILLPFSEQKEPVKKGHKVLVGIYTDKSGRLCATQKVRKILTENHSYNVGDVVSGIVYEMSEDIGAFVAVENKYFGLILSNEVMPYMKVGTEVTGRITKVREDGKVNMTVNKRIDLQMDEDSQRIYDALTENDGYLPYHDKTDSETIKRVFHMSKKAFKRAVGRLYKEQKIRIESDGIHLA